ncbi:MAG TPA: hypothetical protein VM012_02455 [Flavitalea sp.]|nr:hypothetical protein [Flavitalea sp.]
MMRSRQITYYGILLFFSCAGRSGDLQYQLIAGNTATATANCTTPRKITGIHPEDVYDLSAYESVGGNSAFNLFDENGSSDPAIGKGKDAVTSPHPFRDPEIYFPKNIGSRIVIDLKIPYQLKEIYLYDRSQKQDSVWIYTGTMKEWKLKAAFRTSDGDFGWRKAIVEDSTRFLMIRFASVAADIREMVLYGCALAPVPPEKKEENYTGVRLPAKKIREFIGVNGYQATPIEFMKPFYYSRVYTYINQIDTDTTNQYPDISFHLTPHGWYHTGVKDYALYPDSIVRFNKTKLWYSLLGIPKWMEIKGYSVHDKPVTKPGMNTEDPSSYARHASMMWNLAASYGATKVDTALIASNSTNPKFSGRNVMTTFENGNENDAYWVGDKFWTPMEYFAMSSADYDGHEGLLGKRNGIKNADPGSSLMLSGFASLNSNRLRILKFLCNNLRSDSTFLWKGGIQYHHYSTNGKGKTPLERFGNSTGGITPEEDSLRQKLTAIRDRTYRIQPGVECILGEYGYDKSRKSKVSAPLVPGYSQSESQGIMILRAINATAFSGFDRFILYWIKDTENENHDGVYLTSGVLYQDPNQNYTPYPGWYYINTLVNHLGDYVPEKVISEKGKVWIYQYRNSKSRDSVAYFMYCPTHNGTTVKDFTFNTRSLRGEARKVTFQDKQLQGKEEMIVVKNGVIRVNVTENPSIIFVRE